MALTAAQIDRIIEALDRTQDINRKSPLEIARLFVKLLLKTRAEQKAQIQTWLADLRADTVTARDGLDAAKLEQEARANQIIADLDAISLDIGT